MPTPTKEQVGSILAELNQNEKFRLLKNRSPEKAKIVLKQAVQKRLSSVPRTESFLQKAIQSVKGASEGFMDVYTLGGSAFARGMADKLIPVSPEVQNELDQMNKVNPVAKFIGGSVPVAAGIGAMGKGIFKGIQSLRTSPLKEAAAELAYKGKNDLLTQVDDAFKTARETYKEALSKIDPSKIKPKDFLNTIEKVIKEKGLEGKQFLDQAERNLLALRKSLRKGSQEMIVRNPIMNTVQETGGKALKYAAEIKNFKNSVFKALSGRPDLEAEFLKTFGDDLAAKGIDQLVKPNALYKKAYESFDAARKITRASIKRIATGKAPPSEIKEMGVLAGKVGQKATDIIDQAGKIGQSLIKTQKRQKIAKAVGIGVPSLLGIKELFGRLPKRP